MAFLLNGFVLLRAAEEAGAAPVEKLATICTRRYSVHKPFLSRGAEPEKGRAIATGEGMAPSLSAVAIIIEAAISTMADVPASVTGIRKLVAVITIRIVLHLVSRSAGA